MPEQRLGEIEEWRQLAIDKVRVRLRCPTCGRIADELFKPRQYVGDARRPWFPNRSDSSVTPDAGPFPPAVVRGLLEYRCRCGGHWQTTRDRVAEACEAAAQAGKKDATLPAT